MSPASPLRGYPAASSWPAWRLLLRCRSPALSRQRRQQLRIPAFALIAAKLAGDAAHGVAIDAVDAAERQYGYDCDNVPDPVEDAYQRSEAACHAVFEADWRLATTPPTTLAGVAAVLRFANAIEDGGMEWPATDTIGREGWHYQLRATMAAAIEALIEAQAGKAVQS